MKIKYLLSAGALVALSATAQTLQTTQKGDTTIIKVENPTKYLILPIAVSYTHLTLPTT